MHFFWQVLPHARNDWDPTKFALISETSVNTMKEELIALQPGLLKAKEETAILSKQVEEAIPGVDAQKAVAMKDEEATAKQAAEVKKVKDECEADLAEAIPILNEALAALNTIQKKDIDLVKAMGKPPEGVQLAMKGKTFPLIFAKYVILNDFYPAVLIMLDLKPDKKPDPDKPGAKIDDWFVAESSFFSSLIPKLACKFTCLIVMFRWAPSVRLLTSGSLLQTLVEYDKDHMQPRILERIRKEFVPDPKFTPAQIAKASSAAEGLCKWVLAMVFCKRSRFCG